MGHNKNTLTIFDEKPGHFFLREKIKPICAFFSHDLFICEQFLRCTTSIALSNRCCTINTAILQNTQKVDDDIGKGQGDLFSTLISCRVGDDDSYARSIDVKCNHVVANLQNNAALIFEVTLSVLVIFRCVLYR